MGFSVERRAGRPPGSREEGDAVAEADLSQSLAVFESAAQRLNQASDSLNDILSTMEKRLATANAGIEAWGGRALTSSDAEGSVRGQTEWVEQRLGFAKLNGKWCLAVKGLRIVTGFFEGDTSMPYQNEYVADEPSPLLNAARDVRIAALRELPNLIAALTDRARAAAETIDEAANGVRQL
jgi:hypothetical protein